MGDRFEKLENELAAMRPRAVSRKLADRIGAELAVTDATRGSFADRVLMGFMSAGAAAACVIVGLLGWQMIPPAAPGGVAPSVAASVASPTLGQYQQALARASDPSDMKVSMP